MRFRQETQPFTLVSDNLLKIIIFPYDSKNISYLCRGQHLLPKATSFAAIHRVLE